MQPEANHHSFHVFNPMSDLSYLGIQSYTFIITKLYLRFLIKSRKLEQIWIKKHRIIHSLQHMSLPIDTESLKKINKPELIEKLFSALVALKCAEETILRQSDSLVLSTNELVKQCEMSRSLSIKKTDINPSSSEQRNYADVVKRPSTIILKPNMTVGSGDKIALKNKFDDALKNVNVNNARVTENGYFIVNVPNEENYNRATNNLRSVFSNDFSFENLKKLLPKLTITNIPKDIEDSDIIPSLCNKDVNINEMIQNGEMCELLRSWDMRRQTAGVVTLKNVALKCSPKIRNYIMNTNDGFVYLNLVRCKTYDRFFISQCYHCCGFNHFAKNCPDKYKLSICAKCAGVHSTKTVEKMLKNV